MAVQVPPDLGLPRKPMSCHQTPAPHPQTLFLVALLLIPSPKPSPFSSPFPLYATSWVQVAAFISGLLLHMLYGSRERASGRQSTRVGNSSGATRGRQPLGKGLPSINPASLLLPAASHLPLGPSHQKRGRKRGNSQSPTARASLGGPLGFRTPPGVTQVQKLQFHSTRFSSLPLLEAILTTSLHT